jgi:hypothetical protein
MDVDHTALVLEELAVGYRRQNVMPLRWVLGEGAELTAGSTTIVTHHSGLHSKCI